MVVLTVAVSSQRSVVQFSRSHEAVTQGERHVFVDRAGMRFLLLHAQLREHVENNARFHFQFPRQLIDSNFFHRRDC
jgi:hypothetical protein